MEGRPVAPSRLGEVASLVVNGTHVQCDAMTQLDGMKHGLGEPPSLHCLSMDENLLESRDKCNALLFGCW